MRCQQHAGFTLLELIMVIMVVSLASIPLLGQFTQVARSNIIDMELQNAAQLAQERAEDILAKRRTLGYAAVTTGVSNDVLPSPYNSYSRTVTVSQPATVSGCSPGSTCKSVQITINRGSRKRAEISFVLVDY